jgi:hypothetical protein
MTTRKSREGKRIYHLMRRMQEIKFSQGILVKATYLKALQSRVKFQVLQIPIASSFIIMKSS